MKDPAHTHCVFRLRTPRKHWNMCWRSPYSRRESCWKSSAGVWGNSSNQSTAKCRCWGINGPTHIWYVLSIQPSDLGILVIILNYTDIFSLIDFPDTKFGSQEKKMTCYFITLQGLKSDPYLIPLLLTRAILTHNKDLYIYIHICTHTYTHLFKYIYIIS